MEMNIQRIQIPFEDIYTTVFLVQTELGALLFDTATFPQDMDDYVFPALERLSAPLKWVFISHNHRDHAGGLARVLEKYPGVSVAARSGPLCEHFPGVHAPEDGELLMDVLRVVTIPGHTTDCMGLLDTRSGTLLTGDSLQLYGIFGSGCWGANIRWPSEHLSALEKIRTLPVNRIIASHDYHPCGFTAQGAAEIERYLSQCSGAIEYIRTMIAEHPGQSDMEIAQMYNAPQKLPTLGAHVVAAVRQMP